MKKSLLLWPLAFLFAWPSLACAGSSGGTPPASFYCEAARRIATGYVQLIKEQYAGQPQDRRYIEARLKYELAAAKFSGLRATLELEAIGGSRIPNLNEARYRPMVNESLQAFDEFCAAAQLIVLSPELHSTGQQALSPLNFSAVLTDIISFVSKFQDLWVRHDEIRETRLQKLYAWLDANFLWPEWDEIGQPAADGEAQP
ncbi:MAG: hypothetical protein E6X17_08500 [Sporomusaceae bacterium]|nr:hypothetical protein [Sporomusaceae bacterium]